MRARASLATGAVDGDLPAPPGTADALSERTRGTARHRVALIIGRIYAAQTDMDAVRAAIRALLPLAEPQLIDTGDSVRKWLNSRVLWPLGVRAKKGIFKWLYQEYVLRGKWLPARHASRSRRWKRD